MQLMKHQLMEQLRINAECSPLINDLVSRINQWKAKYFDGNIGKVYDSKTARLNAINEYEIMEVSINILIATYLLRETSMHAYIGMVASVSRLNDNEWDNTRSCAEIIAYCDGILYDIIKPTIANSTYSIKPKLVFNDELYYAIRSVFFPMPSVKPLLDWETHTDGGYEAIHENVILGDYFNRHNMPLNLSVLNALQRIRYNLTPNVDTPEKEPFLFEIREQFHQTQKQARKVYAEMKDKTFSFMYQYDKRGRIYCKGYDINLQGNEYRKASLEFTRKEKLTERGVQWLKIAIANHLGLDKLSFKERINYVDNHINGMLRNPQSFADTCEVKGGEPLLLLEAIRAYKEGIVENKPIGFICYLDATASGPQIMSTLSRDEIGMKYLNVLNDDERYDLYTLVTQYIYERTKDSTLWKDFNGDFASIRKVVKKAVMTSYYNSESKPKEVFGEHVGVFYEALEHFTPGAVELQKLINSCWNDSFDEFTWTLPDGHTAYCPVSLKEIKKIELHEIGARINYQLIRKAPNKNEHRSLCPNVVHSIDGWLARKVVAHAVNKGFDITTIHDSFGTHPNYCDEVRTTYRSCLNQLYYGNIVNELLKQITKNDEFKTDLPSISFKTSKQISNNVDGYYIC